MDDEATNGNAAATAEAPAIGTIVSYYADLDANRGMKSNDDDAPFAALVVGDGEDGTINLVVFDHRGGIHPTQSVSLDKLQPPPAEPESSEETQDAGDGAADQDPSLVSGDASSQGDQGAATA